MARLAAAAVVVLVFAGPAAAALPSSMAALGDSLTRGYGAGGGAVDYPAESWSTGTDAAVNSHYLRLLALNPAISGNQFNDAVSGSTMAATFTQAGNAIAQGADYVTIWSGTNDVCTPTVGQMTSVASYTSSLQSTLSRLTSSLPGVQILVLSVPDWYGFWQKFSGTPAAVNAWATYARCPDLLGAGATAADRQAVQTRINDLNAAIVSVCAQFAGCGTDGGAVFRLWSTLALSDLAFDYFHIDPSGEAKVASTAWGVGVFVAPTNIAAPVISGTPQAGQTLTTSNGSWTGAPTGYTYQWQSCNGMGSGCFSIAGATGPTYLVQSSDVGRRLRVSVTASNDYGSAGPVNSATTAVVTANLGVPVNTGLPVVSGVAQVGQTLSSSTGSWTNSPTSYSYQWQSCDSAGANCVAIAGATASSYLVQAGDVGHTLRSTVVASNAAGSSSPASSAATSVVTSSGSTKQFGNTSVGSTWVSPGAGFKFGSVFRLSESGTLVDFKWYTRGGSSSQRFTPVVYSTDASGNPTSLVATGSEVTVGAGQAAGWVTSTLPATALPAGQYLLGLLSGPNGSGASNAMTSSGTGFWNANAYGSPTASWGQINTETATWSFYVDYH
jgi:lysophospholipase L1-like esterase